MPAVSKKQQKFFGIVRAIQKGEQAPTTPETAKAAADMKKGDVKKFASTKHKGLPEKKKIVEDKQVKKIIKQLRKSVKSHKKQADTLEKKIKTFKESAFTNITVGNKVGQTFQHASGATITLDNTMSDPSDLPSQVRIDLGGGDFLTVPAPSTNEYGIAGITSSLGNAGGGGGVQTRQPTKSADEINQQLDASQQASGAETAKVGDALTQLMFGDTETSFEKAIKNLIGHIGGYHPSGPQQGELVSHVADRGTSVVDIYMKELTKYGIDQKKHVEKITKEYKAFKQDLRDSGQTYNEINKNRYIKAFKSDIERETKRLNHIKQDQLDLRGAKDKLENLYKKEDQKLRKGSFDADMNYIPPGFEDAIRTDQIGDTQGEFMPSNPPGMRQQGVSGGETKPEGLSRVVAGLADLATGQKFDFDQRGNIDLNLVKTKDDLPKNIVVDAMAKLVRKATSGYSLPVDLTLKYALGDNSPVTKSPGKGFNQETLKTITTVHKPGTTKGEVGESDYGKTGAYDGGNISVYKQALVQGAFNNFNYEVTPKGIRVIDRFNFDDPNIPSSTTIGGLKQIGTIPGTDISISQIIATNLVRIGDLRARLDGKDPRDDKNYGPKIDYIIPKNELTAKQKDIFYGRTDSTGKTFPSTSQIRADAAAKRGGTPAIGGGNAGASTTKYTPQQIKTAADMQISVETLVNSHNRAIKAGSKNSGIDSKTEGLIKAGNWSWSDYIDRTNAINIAASDKAEPLHKKLRELPVDNRPNRGPSKASLALSDAIEKITLAAGKQLEALWNAWTEYNKLEEPPTTGGKLKGGQGGRRLGSTTQRQGGAYNPRNPYGTGLDRSDVSFKKTEKQKKNVRNVRGSGARGGRRGRVYESKLSFELIQQFREGLNPDRPNKLKEQTTFPQMQERIRNAKEKRREQQKKSEKLYMDTKKKGVKFYDKKGTGRLKDGKKVYD